MSKLILTRHGQSTWNAENRFTGWVDVDLSEKGKEEAKKSGELIRKLNIKEKDDFYRSLSDGQILPGSDQFFPILYLNTGCLCSPLRKYPRKRMFFALVSRPSALGQGLFSLLSCAKG